ncbi:hypothetical protein FRC14_006465 [Serendipita sp. 396]|nr:hypothetical protein FRC14_006465 [Serendipita sp. 396]
MDSTDSSTLSSNGSVISGGGFFAFRAKSSQLSMNGRGMCNSFTILRPSPGPPVWYAAPMIASATSATHFEEFSFLVDGN